MIISRSNAKRNISAKISPIEKDLAKTYIKDAVNKHCEKSPQNPFSVRILFGGDNRDWNGTPLQCIYNYYKYKLKLSNAKERAAKDVGWLFKEVLCNDTLVFQYVGKDTGSIYKLVIN